MKLKILINIILIILTFLFQFSFLSHFGSLQYINLPLILLVILLVIFSEHQAILWTSSLAILMDIYSHQFFGIISISFLITFLITNTLFRKTFTNYSLTTLLTLGIISTITFNLSFFVINFFLSYPSLNQPIIDHFWLQKIIWQLVYHTLLLACGFIIINKFTQKLKSSFLAK